MKDPVDGVAQVVGSTQPPDSATSGNVNLTLVVQGEGVSATTIEHSCLAPTKKWPYPGETLPVTFDRADPDRLKVRWDDVQDSSEVSRQQAEALAAQLNQAGDGSPFQVEVGEGDDRLAQLERLAKLKESGALSEEEFTREKARILGS
jgi:hypothetical protein